MLFERTVTDTRFTSFGVFMSVLTASMRLPFLAPHELMTSCDSASAAMANPASHSPPRMSACVTGATAALNLGRASGAGRSLPPSSPPSAHRGGTSRHSERSGTIASLDVSATNQLRRWLARPIADIVREADPRPSAWEGILWDSPPAHFVSFPPKESGGSVDERFAAYCAFVDRQSELIHEGHLVSLAFHPLLSSAATTPFVLAGLRCRSVEAFYGSLKFPEGSAERTAFAAGDVVRASIRARERCKTFRYGGVELRVGSVEHAALIACAIEAKIEQHRDARHALLESRRALIVLNARRPRAGTKLLGSVTPFVLMCLRAKIAIR